MKKRFFSILLALALCLTLLPGAVFAAGSDTSGHWAEETIAKWQQKGCVSGYSDGTFRPDSSITRAEFVKLFNRVLGLTAEAAIDFADVKESAWFYSEVAKAAAAGYASGSDGMFRPNAPITRAEAAVMLARALGLVDNEGRAGEFADAAAIPAWAKGSIGAVAEAGYMTGYPDGSFGAKDSITRAQTVVTLDRTQNVTVTASGTVLTDKTIAGDLIIAESVGEGEVTLKNVTVEGSLIIRGGGANSVYLNGVTVKGEVRLEKENLHLRLLGGTKLGTVRALAKVKISGSGTIELLIALVSGVTIDRNLTIRKTETADGAKAPTVYNPGGSSSGSSSGGSGTPSQPTTPTVEVKAIGTVADIEVATGTLKTEEEAIAALPKQAVMMDSVGSSIKDNGANVLADVTWTFTGCTITSTDASGNSSTTDAAGFKGSLETGETQCVNTFTGKVTMPSGYTFTGDTNALTITTTITVKQTDAVQLKTIGSAAIADIAQDLESYVSEGKIVEVLRKEKLLPTKLSLYCEAQFVMTVDIPESTNWTAKKSTTSGKEGHEQYELTPDLDWTEIEKQIPAGYHLKKNSGSVDLNPNCSVYVKKLDDSKLQAAIKAATELKNSISEVKDSELDQATDSSKTYIITKSNESDANPDAAKIASEITKDVEFVVDDGTYSAFGTTLKDAQDKSNNILTAFNYQAECDTLTKELETATTTLETLLKTATTGTKMNDAYVVGLVKDWLDKRGNSPWDEGVVLTPNGNITYSLPTQNTFLADPDAGIEKRIDVTLEWNFNNTLYLQENQDGALALTTQTPTEPTDVPLTVTLTEYTIGNDNPKSNLSLTVGDYNVKVGAPIQLKENTVEHGNLTSGGRGETSIAVETPSQADLTIQNASLITITEISEDKTLLNGLSMVSTLLVDFTTGTRGIRFTIAATTAQLPAVVASATPTAGIDYETAKVTLKIPCGAVTLTDWAIKQGWYVPENGLELKADVNIYYPLVKIDRINTTTESGYVSVYFNSEYWGDSYRAVWMALVPENVTNFTGSAVGSSVSGSGPLVTGSGETHNVNIPESGIKAGGKYYVWVKIGDDGNWMKSTTTYTHSGN